MKFLKKLKNIDNIINIILLIIIAFGIGTSIYMLFVSRSLWIDEAAFSYSFSQRNLINLTFGAFEWEQIAPIIYIYIVKIITIILGNSEITLRLFSVIAYVLVLIFAYKCSKDIFKFKYPLLPVAYIATITTMLRYSNEFKTYMLDAAICLIVLYLYYLYNKEKLDFKKLIILFVILIWASNPVCFLIGGILLCEFITGIEKKDYKYVKNIIISIVCVLASFGIYYVYWLGAVSASSDMRYFWENQAQYFPLIPTSLEDFSKMGTIILGVLKGLDAYQVLIGVLAIASIVIGIYKKDKYKIAILFTILITLFASYIEMFPLAIRLCVFIYPILAILAFDTLNMLFSEDRIKKTVLIIICFILLFSNRGVIHYLEEDNVYLYRQEPNATIQYLEENIKEDEKIYVYYYALPNFQYKNGYGSTTFGKYNNEVMYGSANFLRGTPGLDPEQIIGQGKVYIVITNYNDYATKEFFYLTEKGYLELEINPYDTPLYYYVDKIEDMKTDVEYEIVETKLLDERYILTVKVTNIGGNILNHSFEHIYLSSKQDEGIKGNLCEKLEQNNSYEITVELDFEDTEELELQLYSEKNYWFDELGIEPIKVQKDMFKKVQ